MSPSSTSLGTVTLSGGSASLATSALSSGSHSITAVYSGDGSYANSTSAVVSQVVNKIATTTTAGSSPNPSTYGQPVTFIASVSPSAATGTVQFLDGSTSLGTVTLSGGTASLVTSALSSGSHSITAVYSGDGSYANSTAAAVSQVVNKIATTTTAGSSPNPSTYGQAVTLTASVSPSAATGTVQFLDGSTSLGTVTLSGGTASLVTSALSSGSHSIIAAYSGDGSYVNSTSAAVSQIVKQAPPTTAIISSANPANYGQSVTFRAVVTPASASGSVQFLDGTTVLGAVTVVSGGAALSTSSLSSGGHSISAVYSGDASFTG